MAFSINFNSEATNALSILQSTSKNLAETQSRIASGLKVASSRDDASTFNIAQGLRSTIQTQNTISQSIALGQSTLSVATAATSNISDTINSIRDKVIQSQGENVDRAVIQADIDELVLQIQSQVQSASFNGANLLDDVTGSASFNVLVGLNNGTADELTVNKANLTTAGALNNSVALETFDGTASTAASLVLANAHNGAVAGEIDSVTLEVADPAAGNGETKTITVDTSAATDLAGTAALLETAVQALGGSFADATVGAAADGRTLNFSGGAAEDSTFIDISVNFGGGGLAALKNIDVTGTDSARTAALATVDSAQTTVQSVDSALGSKQSRLDQQNDFITSLVNSLESGLSSLVDADLTEESVNLSRLQTQQQLGFQTLSIAGQQTQALLGLFR